MTFFGRERGYFEFKYLSQVLFEKFFSHHIRQQKCCRMIPLLSDYHPDKAEKTVNSGYFGV